MVLDQTVRGRARIATKSWKRARLKAVEGVQACSKRVDFN